MSQFLNKLPFAHHAWFMYLRLLFRHFLSDGCSQRAASLTYTTLLSLVPIITVILVVFSMVPALADVREQVQNAIYSNLLPASNAAISEHINDFTEKSSNLGLIGVLGLFVTTIMTLMTIEEAFNTIWRVSERSGGLSSVLRYWTMITLAPIVLGVAFGASSAIRGISFMNQQIAGYGIDWAIWAQIVSFLFTVAGFIGMYWFVPKVNVPIKYAAIAGVIVAVLFETLKQLFGTVMSNFTSYEAIYGAFAALPVFLLWIYLSWNVILLGVEISYTLTIFDSKEVAVRHPLLSLLDMLNLIYKRYQQGKTVSEKELRDVLGRKELPKWNLYIDELVRNELIASTKDDRYILCTNLDGISLWQFYKKLPYPLPIKDELDKLQQADYDPWFVELYQQLDKIESVAKKELDISLGALFQGTPLRQKQQITQLQDQPSSPNSDHDGFHQDATHTTDAQGNTFIIPDGKAKHTQSALTTAIKFIKKARHWFGKGKKVASDVKKGLE